MKINLYEILVPTISNDGKPFRTRYHKVWDAKVKNITGGLSILKPLKGIWVNEGMTYEERNIPVRVACTREDLDKILSFTREYYSQIKVMAYKISEEVIFYP
jgi:hypothetical protein